VPLNRSIKSLNLAHNQIRKTEELINLNELEILDLSSNQITDWYQIVCIKFNILYHLIFKFFKRKY
jgi:Leucine-rich repeat (LRR) protein